MSATAAKAATGRPAFNHVRHRRIFVPVIAALTALAWATLWTWGHSPYGRYLDHGDWMGSEPVASLCRIVPGGDTILPVVLYAVAWILMTAAMMLPTTLPLFNTFDRLTSERKDHAQLLTLLGLGYMTVWAAFGLFAHPLHALALTVVDRVPTLAWNSWLIGAAIIALAGAFQFSRLKHRCLEKCRTPLSFVIAHWRGQAQARHAFALGAHHGLFCVGCCWALMLLMFAVGMGNLGWMLVLAALMATEKNFRWGHHLSAPLGVALLVWAIALVVTHS